MPMKILHISKYYYPYIGGVENICKYLVERMPQHKTSVVCFSDSKEDSVDDVNGHTIYRAGSFANIARQSLSMSYGKVLKAALEMEQPDVIQYHWANPFPAVFLRMMISKETKLVVHWHMDIIRQKYLYWVVKPWEKWLVRRADRIVVTSPQYREGSKPLQKVKHKVSIVPNCIEEDKLILRDGDEVLIAAIKAKYGHKPIIFFMGRHIQYKGLPHLINAERHMTTDAVIVIGGSGPLTEELKSKARYSNRIFFTGRLSEDELRCHLYAASVFAFPSITKNEAFGVALAEAMYCYTPAVTFTIEGSGVNWVNLNGVTGIEVPQGDEMDMQYANAIDKLITDQTLNQEYSENAHKRVVENFMTKHMISAMEGVYQEL